MHPVLAALDDPALEPVRGRMTLPNAAEVEPPIGVDVHPWAQLLDPARDVLDRVAADWSARGGFTDHRRPWVLTVFGLAHQLTHATVAHLILTDRVLDLTGLHVRVRRTGELTSRAAGLVLHDPAPAWTGTRSELADRWWQQTEQVMRSLIYRARQHGVRDRAGWGEPVGLATVACHTLGQAGVPGTRQWAEELAAVSRRHELTTVEDDPAGEQPGWRARRTTCCQWWQSQHDAHYCRECPIHLAPRASSAPLPVDH